jgi:hypothetical protein
MFGIGAILRLALKKGRTAMMFKSKHDKHDMHIKVNMSGNDILISGSSKRAVGTVLLAGHLARLETCAYEESILINRVGPVECIVIYGEIDSYHFRVELQTKVEGLRELRRILSLHNLHLNTFEPNVTPGKIYAHHE